MNINIKIIILFLLFSTSCNNRRSTIQEQLYQNENTGNDNYKNERSYLKKNSGKDKNLFDGNIVEKRLTSPPNGGTYIPKYEIGVRVSLDDSIKVNKDLDELIKMDFYESFEAEGFFTRYIINLKKLLYANDPKLAQELFDVSMAFRCNYEAPNNSMGYVMCQEGASQGHFFIWASFLFDKGAVFKENYYTYIFKFDTLNDDFSDIRSHLNYLAFIISWGFDIYTQIDNPNSIVYFIRDIGIKMGNKKLDFCYFNGSFNDFIIKEDMLDNLKTRFNIIDYLDQDEKKLVEKIKFYKNRLLESELLGDNQNVKKYTQVLDDLQPKTSNPNFNKETNTYSLPPKKILDILEHHFFLRLCKQLLKFKQKRPLDRKFLTLINRYKLKDEDIIEELSHRVDGKIVPFDWNTDFEDVDYW